MATLQRKIMDWVNEQVNDTRNLSHNHAMNPILNFNKSIEMIGSAGIKPRTSCATTCGTACPATRSSLKGRTNGLIEGVVKPKRDMQELLDPAAYHGVPQWRGSLQEGEGRSLLIRGVCQMLPAVGRCTCVRGAGAGAWIQTGAQRGRRWLSWRDNS